MLAKCAQRFSQGAAAASLRRSLVAERATKAVASTSPGSIPSHFHRRWFSSSDVEEGKTSDAYEYPTRTEAPVVSKTKAGDVSSSTTSSTTAKVYTPDDPFDDSNSLSPEERDEIIQKQQQAMKSLQLSSLPITQAVPDFIPPNVPSQELEAPETIITTLDNGVRVVSQETYSQMCTVGVLTNVPNGFGELRETVVTE